MTLRELQDAYAAGQAIVTPDEAQPWAILKCSRASFYRALRADQIPGTLRLGRSYRLQLGTLLRWLGALPQSHERARNERRDLELVDAEA